ncbi:MAG: hypothetical protein GY878_29760 [Fuerstiella sp.]|nr:hypothetical protein [Fuerstiella sp.]
MSRNRCVGRNGDMEANDAHERFTRLLIEREPELVRCVLVAVPIRTDAPDIMQECSVALWRRFADFDADRPFAAGHWRLMCLRSARMHAAPATDHALAAGVPCLYNGGVSFVERVEKRSR